jgi:hypothetical protein
MGRHLAARVQVLQNAILLRSNLLPPQPFFFDEADTQRD